MGWTRRRQVLVIGGASFSLGADVDVVVDMPVSGAAAVRRGVVAVFGGVGAAADGVVGMHSEVVRAAQSCDICFQAHRQNRPITARQPKKNINSTMVFSHGDVVAMRGSVWQKSDGEGHGRRTY